MMRKNSFVNRAESAGPARRRNNGFTLIELMIAMFLSLFLMAGVIQLFLQSKTTYMLQEGVARAQESGRLSLYLVEEHLRRAAYPLDALPLINGFARDQIGSTPAFTSSQIIPSDSALVIQYQSPDGGIDDCTGRNIAANNFVSMHYYISDEDELKCESAITTDTTSPASAILIENISTLQLSYGMDTDGDGAANGSYKAVADIATADDWEKVVAVQVAVTVPVLPAHLSGNRVLEFSTTVPIRNQMERK
ncbi:MAG: PilW family protein [Candidatus Sedimenticola sp. (ex Thyasira tokunagai)]